MKSIKKAKTTQGYFFSSRHPFTPITTQGVKLEKQLQDTSRLEPRKRYKSANQIKREPLIERLPIVPIKINLEKIMKLNNIYMELMKLIKERDYINIFNKCSQWWDTTVDNNFPLLNVRFEY